MGVIRDIYKAWKLTADHAPAHDIWDDPDLADPIDLSSLKPIGVYAHFLIPEWQTLTLDDGGTVLTRVLSFRGPNLDGGGDTMTVRVALNGAVLKHLAGSLTDDYVNWAVKYMAGGEV